jgi:thioredoxin-like negative regulator of GroEL
MPIDRSTILYFLSQPGCSHCAMARPAVEALRRKHLGTVLVLELNADNHPQIDDFKVKVTPSYVLKRSGFIVATKEGGLSLAQLEKLIETDVAGAVRREAAPRRRPPKHREPGEDQDPEEVDNSEDA